MEMAQKRTKPSWSICVRNLQRSKLVSVDRTLETAYRMMEALSCEVSELVGDSFSLSVAFVGKRTIAELNKKYLGKASPTDVLAFPLWGDPATKEQKREDDKTEAREVELGEVVICPSVADDQHQSFGTTYEEELDRLLIHGTLHLIGYDHERSLEDEKRMKEKEGLLWKSIGEKGLKS